MGTFDHVSSLCLLGLHVGDLGVDKLGRGMCVADLAPGRVRLNVKSVAWNELGNLGGR